LTKPNPNVSSAPGQCDGLSRFVEQLRQSQGKYAMPQPSTVKMPRPIFNAIIEHAREGKPHEICGVLRGRGMDAYEIYRARNLAEDSIENYVVDPQTLLLQFEFEDAGDEMMGVYHSHPASVAYPSATDAWNAHYPDSLYFICSLEDDNAPVLRAFRMTPHFPELDMDTLRRDLAFEEVRPGLFGYFQAADAAIPATLVSVVAQVAPPFYVVFRVEDPADVRVVFIAEYSIVMT
jgi:proteasome lid subunit RPN8/RPN11